MKRLLVVLPVVIALLTFGLSVKSMAVLNGNDVLVPIDESIAVNDTLNHNKVDVKDNTTANDDSIAIGKVDVDVKDTDINKSHNNGDAEVEHGDYNAVANNGSIAKVDNSLNIKDIKVAVAVSDLDGLVTGAPLVGIPILGEIERSFNTGDNRIGGDGRISVNGVANISQNTGQNALIQQSNTFNASVK